MDEEDKNFIREVNEELRSDAMTAIWKRYGKFIIGAAVLIVVGTAGNVGYQTWKTSQAATSGDAFLEALTLARDGKQDEALAAFKTLEQDGYGSYPVLARMRAATVLADKGDAAAAISAFSSIGTDASVTDAIRDVAKIRAGYLLVDHGSYDDVSAEVEALSGGQNAMRHSAREILGLSAYNANDLTKAREWFELIVGDVQTPAGVQTRAQLMLDLIAGRIAAT